jgi:hypothetical protein
MCMSGFWFMGLSIRIHLLIFPVKSADEFFIKKVC